MLFQHPPSEALEGWEEPAIRWCMRHAVARRLVPPDEADDLTQACLMHWLEVRGRYDPARGANPETYLKRVTRNYLIDFGRRYWLRRRGLLRLDASYGAGAGLRATLRDPTPDPSEVVIADDRSVRVREAIDSLGRRERAVARGLAKGQSVSELSRALGLSRPSLYRVMARIREVLRERHVDER